jgi:hypothetical protein
MFAELIWRRFHGVFEAYGKFTDFWLPMKQVTSVVELLYLDYYHQDALDFVITDQLVDTLIEQAHFMSYLEFLDSELVGDSHGK